jgi:transcriptional regulator GlxA family with amidase domain
LAHNDQIRVQLVSNFLLGKIRKKVDCQNGFIKNVKLVIEANRILPIDLFADDCNLSRRQFERKFKENAGLTPKDFFSIVRFKNALKEIEEGSKQLAQIAIETGYFDQPHFTNEFRKYSGYSPREYAMNHHAEVDLRATRDFRP